jgi:hypothetical protein
MSSNVPAPNGAVDAEVGVSDGRVEDVLVPRTIAVDVDAEVRTGVKRMGVETLRVGNENAVGVLIGSRSSAVGDSATDSSMVAVTTAGSVPTNEYLKAVAVGTSSTVPRNAVIRPAARTTQRPIREKTATPIGIRIPRSKDG